MTTNLDQTDLRSDGTYADTDESPQAMPLGTGPRALPDDTWEMDDLEKYVARELAGAEQDQAQSLELGRRSSVRTFRAGRALAIIRARLKRDGEWCAWQNTQNFCRSTVFEAIRLSELAGTEEAVAGLTLSEAKRKYGILARQRDSNLTESAGLGQQLGQGIEEVPDGPGPAADPPANLNTEAALGGQLDPQARQAPAKLEADLMLHCLTMRGGSATEASLVADYNSFLMGRHPHDYYATPPAVTQYLLDRETFTGLILDAGCGTGAISKVLLRAGHWVRSIDKYFYGYGEEGIDFLTSTEPVPNVIINPPYRDQRKWVEQALALATRKVAVLLQFSNFSTNVWRREPLSAIHVLPRELTVGLPTRWLYAWYVWDKNYQDADYTFRRNR